MKSIIWATLSLIWALASIIVAALIRGEVLSLYWTFFLGACLINMMLFGYKHPYTDELTSPHGGR